MPAAPALVMLLASTTLQVAPAPQDQGVQPGQLQTAPTPDISIQQIPADGERPVRDKVEQVDNEERAPTQMAQLPDDAELPPTEPGPEGGLEIATRASPREDLYNEVATVWELIRRRGQQPTPELIAREIGPDMLARFLNTFPGSEGMFGVDSDRLPVRPPSPPPATGK